MTTGTPSPAPTTRTVVFFHAHPDDEAIATGGTMARLASEGHRVVLVVATRGELGEVDDGFLAPGEQLWERRVAETLQAGELLGVARVEFLGYHDSGMAGEPTNHHDGAFASTPVDEAAARLAEILRDERADVLTVYDDHGGYGHPDHVQVHHVGHRAAVLAGTPQVFESTANRDHIMRMMEQRHEHPDLAAAIDAEDDLDEEWVSTFGSPEAILTTVVDCRDLAEVKRTAMAAHASQIDENSFFLQMPLEVFRDSFGWECYIRKGGTPGAGETSLLEHLA